ncbi:hypothetical protein [uncultured Paludibaculum sp.]|uniref:hypothetical protein n=1 Tax=uncultured Paludibaculum sp. TaxID=1765020 RepID=UPI002AAA8EC7|nr:hypothetical protein [uncultured Paludibaculum sp.]
MCREVSTSVLLVTIASGLPFLLGAANSELWKEGAWVVEAPPSGQCGSLPLLQVKGPGSILDPQNASVFANLEKSLPAALAKVCPGTREVILMSGRTRRLVRLAEPAAGAAPPAPSPEPPSRRRLESQPTAVEPVQPQPATVVSGPAIPALTRRSDLHSLSSAHSIEDKCEVLLSWLESGKTASTPAVNYRYRQAPEMLGIFRDEPMMAVFEMPYDKTENRWRLEQHEKVISRCVGSTPSRPNPFTHQPNRRLMQYSQQFAQYAQLLDQAFLGQPGPFEPTTVSRYVQQVREQIGWAQQAMTAAAAGAPTRSSFDRIRGQQQAAGSQLSLLSASEKSQVTDYLGRRQTEMAPIIAEEWFREASASQKGTASAKALVNSHAALAPVVNALNGETRGAFEDKYRRLVESLVAEPLQAETTRLQAIPATLPGVLQITAWKASFDAGFQGLRGFSAVDAAGQEFNQVRARVLAGALPSWMQDVGAIPVDGAAITAKRREMETLFPSREDRSSPQFVQYEAPLRAKEDQLRLRVEAEMRKQQQEANAAALLSQQAAAGVQREPSGGGATGAKPVMARGGQSAALTEGSFSASGLHNERVLMSLYRGDFTSIEFDRDEIGFMGMFGQYLNSYGRQCDAYLPANKVEMTRQRCTAEMVTRNGYGVEVSRYCSNWVTEGTGVYADPQMYATKRKLDQIAAGDAFRTVGKMLTQRDPIAGAMNMVGNAQAAMADMEEVVQKNGCASAGLKRFEENLMLFALNKQPIRLGDSGPRLSAIAPLPGIPFRDQNYTKLVEDLVGEHSKTWAMNRFQRGSVGGVAVSSRDGQGRPSKVVAHYTYDGFSGRSQGSVTLNFTDGLPECMYFFDFPATCRTPNRKIVAAYADGAYQEK